MGGTSHRLTIIPVTMSDFGLYLHIPFCATRCSYCSFVTRDDSAHLMDDYVRALRREIELSVSEHGLGDSVCGSVYFGGGTPSLLAERRLADIMQTLKDRVRMDGKAEITLEANPQDVHREKLEFYKSLGVNRLSIGCQSFHDEILRFLSRRHSAEEARNAVRAAKEAGFDNLSIDLMFNIPGGTEAMWERDVREALALAPKHISLYSLSIDPGTPMRTRLAKGEFELPDDEISARNFILTDTLLISSGYRHYEVSNFAMPGFHSRHNSSYWDGTPYIGAGIGAHSFIEGVRCWNTRTITDYIDALKEGRLPRRESEVLTREERFTERVMLALRTDRGLDLNTLGNEERERLLSNVRLVLDGAPDPAVEIEGTILRIPPRRWVIADEIIARLVRY